MTVVIETAVVPAGTKVMFSSHLNDSKPTVVQNSNKIKGRCVHSRYKGEKKLRYLILDGW